MILRSVLIWGAISLLSCSTLHGGQQWYPYPVEVWDIPYDMTSPRSVTSYIPLQRSRKRWNICVSFPHMKDMYWLAVNFGVFQEVQRLGGTMQLYQAGGYENLDSQITQIKDCIEDGADGLMVASIWYDDLNDLVETLHKRKIPVVDVVNGMSTEKVSAKSLVSFEEMGAKAGEYIVERHKADTGKQIRVAWFPGPRGAGWVNAGTKGFTNALENSSIKIVETRYGDTGLAAQSELLNEVLDKNSDILDYIVGTGVTAEAAVQILRKRGLRQRIKVISYYLTPGVYRGIKRGTILASTTDSAVIQGRIAVDQLIRILEKEEYHKHVGPVLYVINSDTIQQVDRKSMLAPSGFQAIYTVNRQNNLW